MFKKINFYQILITIFAVILASAAIAYGWTAPTGVPPGNDVEAPINTGLTGQIKEGGLSVANTPTISNVGLRVITGNLVIGSSSPAVSKSGIFDEFISARDVWIRDANNGAGAWASSLGGGGYSPGSQTFDSSGNFTVPAGVHQVTVEMWGGGGGGGSSRCSTNYQGSIFTTIGGGGGAGGYARGKVQVTPGQVLYVRVGRGGKRGEISTQQCKNVTADLYYHYGEIGGYSSFVNMWAWGGGGGRDWDFYLTGSRGKNGWAVCDYASEVGYYYAAPGGTGEGGTLQNLSGGNGSPCGGKDWSGPRDVGIGGTAPTGSQSDALPGGAGGFPGPVGSNDGKVPGGGGGGGINGGYGGNGAPGKVIISW